MYGLFDGRDQCARFLAHEQGAHEIFRRLEKIEIDPEILCKRTLVAIDKKKVSTIENLEGMSGRTSLSKI